MTAIIEINHHPIGYFDGGMAVINPSLQSSSIRAEAAALDDPHVLAEINQTLRRNENAEDGLGLLALRTEIEPDN